METVTNNDGLEARLLSNASGVLLTHKAAPLTIQAITTPEQERNYFSLPVQVLKKMWNC